MEKPITLASRKKDILNALNSTNYISLNKIIEKIGAYPAEIPILKMLLVKLQDEGKIRVDKSGKKYGLVPEKKVNKIITPTKKKTQILLENKYEVLVNANNFNNLGKLFVLPKEAREDKEYIYLENYLKDNYPQFNDIEEDDFHNCLDESIIQYLLKNNIEIREGKIIVQFDAKKIFEKGWIPLPGLSDTLPRGYLVDIFLGLICGKYGYNNIQRYEKRDKNLPNPPLRLFDKEEENHWQIIVEVRHPTGGAIIVYLIPETKIPKKLKKTLNSVESSDENDFHKLLSYNIKKGDKKSTINKKIEENITFFGNYETDTGDIDENIKITTILPFFLVKDEHDYRLWD